MSCRKTWPNGRRCLRPTLTDRAWCWGHDPERQADRKRAHAKGRPEDTPRFVHETRERLGLTQEALARAVGVSFASVNRWENGKARPQKWARERLADLARRAPSRAGRIQEARDGLIRALETLTAAIKKDLTGV